jgi:sugar phosphate isomerase/epimerase
MREKVSRRNFLQKGVSAGIGLTAIPSLLSAIPIAVRAKMKLGLVTYQWGKDWDLQTIISNCEKAGLTGVELRTEHAHRVESNLSASERADVKKRFADSSVTCVGYGSNFEYHSPDPAILRRNIEQTKDYVRLCEDIGATGLKVKPNTLPEGVAKEKTIAQIAASLNEVGRFAKDYGQLIRLEVHGAKTAELPVMRAIFEQVTEPSVKICWNSNPQDLLPPGLEGNFNMVKQWFGDTVHVHDLGKTDYPYQQLFNLFTQMKYKGWILLEESSNPPDKVAAMKEELRHFKQLLANAKNS